MHAPESAVDDRDTDLTRPRGLAPVFRSNTRVTLVEGSTFCVSDANGNITPGFGDGLFVQDTRLLSRWVLRVGGVELEALSAVPAQAFECTFVCRLAVRRDEPEPSLLVERHRMIGLGMREDITIQNNGLDHACLEVTMVVEADFADLFEVKVGRVDRQLRIEREAMPHDLLIHLKDGPTQQRSVRVTSHGAMTTPRGLSFTVVVPARGTWTTSIEVTPTIAGRELETSFPLDHPIEAAQPALRIRDWMRRVATVSVDNTVLSSALRTSMWDLGSLRITDPTHPEDDVVAAGVPWFMALFGRDSLLTSAMMMPFAPTLAMGTLRTLARFQGQGENPNSEEQPGRILHEVRLGTDASLALGGEKVYYGSIDATPLFVMLVGMALRRGVPREEVRALKPSVDAAVAWFDRYGDRDGDGFVEYCRSSPRGLLNQGWKDSVDSMVHRDGSLATPPIALAEVQGYTYAAYRAAADLEQALGDPVRAEELRARATSLKARFHEAFWMPKEGFYAMALDADKRPLEAVASNVGHCLWTGIVPDEVAATVVDRLLAPDMFTGFGLRTLSAKEKRYNPVSYHIGSVWPHDSILAASGMARYGFKEAAMTIVGGLLDALEAFGGRLPELFCGFDRHNKPVPVPYPTSCSPQAWAAAVPFEMLRIALGLNLDLVDGTVVVDGAHPLVGEADIGLTVGAQMVRVIADERRTVVEGLPNSVRVVGGATGRA